MRSSLFLRFENARTKGISAHIVATERLSVPTDDLSIGRASEGGEAKVLRDSLANVVSSFFDFILEQTNLGGKVINRILHNPSVRTKSRWIETDHSSTVDSSSRTFWKFIRIFEEFRQN